MLPIDANSFDDGDQGLKPASASPFEPRGSHNVAVIAEDAQGLARESARGDVEHRG